MGGVPAPGARPGPYRWAVLAAYMLLTIAIEAQWLALTPVARPAEHFYAGQIVPGRLYGIDLLAMVYLGTYLVVALPASYVIDTFGLRRGLAAGALLAAAGGAVKGLFPGSFALVLGGQVLLGVGQPFVLNAATVLGARWFPLGERGLAVGLASLAQFLGIALAMVAGPLLVGGNPVAAGYGRGVPALLGAYGAGTALAALVCLALVRDRPRGAPAPAEDRLGVLPGLRSLLGQRDFRILLVLFTCGLGIFNALSSMVDALAARMGVADSDGLLGTWMIAGGILGALALPPLSDLFRRRTPFLAVCLGGMVPGVAGLAFAGSLAHSAAGAYALAKASAAVLGFFVMSAGPIGFQYAAEIGRPAPESSSQGLLLLAGQVSGILFMVLMARPAWMGPVLAGFCLLSLVCFGLTLGLRESTLLTGPSEGS